jgi:hypothetical protein
MTAYEPAVAHSSQDGLTFAMSCAVTGARERPKRRQLDRRLGIELRCLGGCRSNCHEVVVAYRANIRWPQGDKRLCSTRRRDKLDDECLRTVDFDDGSQITAPHSFRREIARQHDDIKELWVHVEPPGTR